MEKQIVREIDRIHPEKLQDEEFVSEVEQLLKDCLRHLHVFQCTSLTNMLLSLITLDKVFTTSNKTCVLMIDSISAWYNSADPIENRKYFTSLVNKLRDLVDTYKLVVFVSKAALFTKDCYHSDSKVTAKNVMLLKHNEFLGTIWSSFVTHRLTFLVQNRSGQKTFFVLKDFGFGKQTCVEFSIADSGFVFSNKPITN